ncbi:MAG: MarR family transcriptional regulator [Polyangiaceae bacterium]
MTVRLGVTFQQRTVLRLVGRFPGVTAGKLADTLHVDRGTLSTMLARLEARGLIERRQDTTDRRRVRVGLTSRGRSLDVPDEETVEGAVEEAIHAADPEDVRGTERVLSALVAQLERKQTAVANDTRSRST